MTLLCPRTGRLLVPRGSAQMSPGCVAPLRVNFRFAQTGQRRQRGAISDHAAFRPGSPGPEEQSRALPSNMSEEQRDSWRILQKA